MDAANDTEGSASIPPLQQDDHVRGPAGAPLLIVYGEFTCPRCALAHARLREVGVREVFRHFALGARPRVVALACAVSAAGEQGAFWELHDRLFADQGRQEDPHLWAYAEELGLDLDRFERDRRAPATLTRVREQTRAGLIAGVSTTPTLILGGEVISGPPDAALLARLGAAAGRAIG
ncbi:MAG TPA: DsbA family protein [Solirubrobacteraceae bacterium]|nr:DsbA family protein [Solirubrobacteraceae bacterium]